MVRNLYNLFIRCYPAAIKLAASFNSKAAEWVEGRKHWKLPVPKHTKLVWFHAASVGEFEQAKPLIETFRVQYPDHKILASFFSPSGYNANKQYALADYVIYLPMDSEKNAAAFIKHYRPVLAIFIKYEFWFYYLQELKKNIIPTILVSAVFRHDQIFFKSFGGFFRNMLAYYQQIFVQDENSKQLVSELDYTAILAGDTRFDRVSKIATSFQPIPQLENIIDYKKIIIAGSTWKKDDELLSRYAKEHKDMLLIVAPHEVHESRIKECIELYGDVILFSDIATRTNEQVILINSIGLLSRLYHYATISYVGGGFTKDGVHNTLEAAVHSKPVVFGENFQKYKEAIDLIKAGAAFSVRDEKEMETVFSMLFTREALYSDAAKKAGDYVKTNTGATGKIMQYVQENRLLTN